MTPQPTSIPTKGPENFTMHGHSFAIIGVFFVVCGQLCWCKPPQVDRHVVVFGEDGKFAGWPAGHGMWSWGNEILVGFSVGMYKDLGDSHNIDRDQPEHHVLARSLDGGASWRLEFPAEKGMLINQGGMRKGITDPSLTEKPPVPIQESIEFDRPGFCMTLRLTGINGGGSRLYYSYDRGHNWQGPFLVPDFGQPGVMARTDYVVNRRHDCHVFLTVAKANRREGRVICARTKDGGISWKMLSYVGPEPSGFSIMPATVRIRPRQLVMATRRREGPHEPQRRWIDVWNSLDDGASWQAFSDAVDDVGRGNPPALVKLHDGRLCLTYGVREQPHEICAKLSDDGGRSWGPPFVLKSGGGGWDIGYTRTAQRPDGKVVTVYYYEPADSPHHQIQATIWDPGS